MPNRSFARSLRWKPHQAIYNRSGRSKRRMEGMVHYFPPAFLAARSPAVDRASKDASSQPAIQPPNPPSDPPSVGQLVSTSSHTISLDAIRNGSEFSQSLTLAAAAPTFPIMGIGLIRSTVRPRRSPFWQSSRSGRLFFLVIFGSQLRGDFFT